MFRWIAYLLVIVVTVPTTAAADPDGKEIYARECSDCHMPDGSGDDPAPDIAGIPQNNLRRAMGGLEGMPEFEFTAEELVALHAFLRTLDD